MTPPRPAPEFRRTAPILPVVDIAPVTAWYRDTLGFRVITSQDDPNLPPPHVGYVVLRRGGAEVHLQFQFEKDMQGLTPTAVQLRFELEPGSVDALFDEYRAKGAVPEGKAVRDTDWGTREFAFYDPWGYGVTFFEDR